MNLEKALSAPKARKTDPSTSKEAAERIMPRLGKSLEAVYSSLKRYRNVTSRELANMSGLDRYEVARRLTELEAAGLAERSGKRKCTVQGWNAIVWSPAESD